MARGRSVRCMGSCVATTKRGVCCWPPFAKVAVALLHPHRHTWKQFMYANLERQAPGVGLRVLLQQGSGRLPAGLSQRHAAYVRAFRELELCRHTPHDAMSAHQVRLELLVGNHSVADATTGLAMRSPAALPARLRPRTAGATLGQVSSALSFQPAVDGIVIPPAWQLALQQERGHQVPRHRQLSWSTEGKHPEALKGAPS